MTATILYIRDYHLKRVEKQAAELVGELLDYAEIAKDGGPIVAGATELPNAIDSWAGRHCPDGIDGLKF